MGVDLEKLEAVERSLSQRFDSMGYAFEVVRDAIAEIRAARKEAGRPTGMIDLEELAEAAQKLEIAGLKGDASVVRTAIAWIKEHPERDAPGADQVVEDIGSSMIEDLMIEAKDRRGFARVAANIAEDRYHAGSTAARCAIAILLRHGIKAAVEFAEDLAHHEG